MEKFFLRNKSEFDEFKANKNTKPVNFDLQAKNLLEAGEVIFTELTDGYMTIQFKKGFGISKGKVEIYVSPYDGVPQKYKHSNISKGLKQFSELNKDGQDFFYVDGLTND
ncbi:hypothetical protein MKY95_19115 [Paenibacillus sp. FSL P4-0176]|uniref:hypothetical protein n=1 Tax=Paenibacillus sp. FSL P4-0176 TaxID=2921631 RepID=UPI0030CA6809